MDREFSLHWTPRALKRECSAAHGRYKRELEERYAAYFAARPELAGTHSRKTRDIAAALPPGHESLASRVPQRAWHLQHLSGGSSQVVAVALLGSAIERDPRLVWLSEVLDLPPAKESVPDVTFEYELDPQTLSEEPHVTNIDLLVEDHDLVICVEAKLWEQGLGSCRCGKEKSEPEMSDHTTEQEPTPAQERAACSRRIVERPAYWSAAREVLALPERTEGAPCPIAACYQAVRNIAAARALAGGRHAVFALFHDARNPYFSKCGEWPGWPTALNDLVREESDVAFRSCSWQRLLASGVVPGDVVVWAREKHGLISSPST